MSALVIPYNVRRRMGPRNHREAVHLADLSRGEWNACYPVGTPVKVYPVHGDEAKAFQTRTTSEARVIGGVSAVVEVEGVDYALNLSHVVPLLGSSVCSLAHCGIVTVEGKGVGS